MHAGEAISILRARGGDDADEDEMAALGSSGDERGGGGKYEFHVESLPSGGSRSMMLHRKCSYLFVSSCLPVTKAKHPPLLP